MTENGVAWTESNGVSLRYALSGVGGRVVVLVHELGSLLEGYEELAARLAVDRRILRYDCRGFGLSEKIVGAYSLDDAVADLSGLIEGLGINGRVVVAGGAVGGGIALAFAAAHPDRVSALVAMAPATGIPPERRASVEDRAAMIERDGLRHFTETDILPSAYPELLRADMNRFRRFRAQQLANDPKSYGAALRMLAHAEFQHRFGRIACPTLVLAGVHDPSRPPAVTKMVADAIPDARFQALETGHFMATQTPDLVAATITAFLDSVGA